MFETLRFKPHGHLRIWEKETGNILLEQHNDIHPENMSYAIASSLTGLLDESENCYGHIRKMVFGNGGARVTSSNKYIYSVPQTVGRAATLYNQIYEKDVVENKDENNYMNVTHATGNDYSDIIIRCTIDKDEKVTDRMVATDDENNTIINDVTFNEIGLVTTGGDLITHICFFPIQKSQNTSLIIEYIIRIQIV